MVGRARRARASRVVKRRRRRAAAAAFALGGGGGRCCASASSMAFAPPPRRLGRRLGRSLRSATPVALQSDRRERVADPNGVEHLARDMSASGSDAQCAAWGGRGAPGDSRARRSPRRACARRRCTGRGTLQPLRVTPGAEATPTSPQRRRVGRAAQIWLRCAGGEWSRYTTRKAGWTRSTRARLEVRARDAARWRRARRAPLGESRRVPSGLQHGRDRSAERRRRARRPAFGYRRARAAAARAPPEGSSAHDASSSASVASKEVARGDVLVAVQRQRVLEAKRRATPSCPSPLRPGRRPCRRSGSLQHAGHRSRAPCAAGRARLRASRPRRHRAARWARRVCTLRRPPPRHSATAIGGASASGCGAAPRAARGVGAHEERPGLVRRSSRCAPSSAPLALAASTCRARASPPPPCRARRRLRAGRHARRRGGGLPRWRHSRAGRSAIRVSRCVHAWRTSRGGLTRLARLVRCGFQSRERVVRVASGGNKRRARRAFLVGFAVAGASVRGSLGAASRSETRKTISKSHAIAAAAAGAITKPTSTPCASRERLAQRGIQRVRRWGAAAFSGARKSTAPKHRHAARNAPSAATVPTRRARTERPSLFPAVAATRTTQVQTRTRTTKMYRGRHSRSLPGRAPEPTTLFFRARLFAASPGHLRGCTRGEGLCASARRPGRKASARGGRSSPQTRSKPRGRAR